MKYINVQNIDFLFIDGLHSINQVVSDWKYTEKLSDIGIVGMHDTNAHPGPYCVYDAIDETIFRKKKYCPNNDWGIAFAEKIGEKQ